MSALIETLGVTAAILFFGGFMFMSYFNGKYPKVRFITFRGNVIKTSENRRLYGRSKLVPDNITQIITQGDQILGENINDFERFEIVDKMFGIFKRHTSGYIAYETTDTLIKMDANITNLNEGDKNKVQLYLSNGVNIPVNYSQTQHINFAQIKAAKDIASGFVNTIEDNANLTKKRNQLMDLFINTIPLLIIIGTLLGGLYFLGTMMLEGLNNSALTFQNAARELRDPYCYPANYENDFAEGIKSERADSWINTDILGG